ncbi:hypothetical protein [Virgibacillus proomii]|nr:hypothetical protein [Virgibacillus proomii]
MANLEFLNTELEASVSHSGDKVLVAATKGPKIGVDAEMMV